ncbi:hypothetical protein B566_EDAN008756 [Ephemera danica]|nr:hypothetical protein B566_EDAN008756 [Ephemera danica]
MLSYVLTLGLLALTAHAGNLQIPPQHYIVGGVQASPGEYPSQLSLQYNEVHRCGASIISEHFALTTAYCVCVEECFDQVKPKDPPENFKTIFKLISGTNDLQSTDRVIHDIKSIAIKETYVGEANSWANDIAVIEVEVRSNFDSSLFIDLHKGPPGTGIESPETAVKIVGWGSETEGGPMSDILLEADLAVHDFTTCNERYVEFGATLQDNLHICAAAVDGKRGSCEGDNGGPLLYMDEAAGPVVVGLMSWGLGCARPGYPAVYARTSSHCDWIKANTNDTVICISTSH